MCPSKGWSKDCSHKRSYNASYNKILLQLLYLTIIAGSARSTLLSVALPRLVTVGLHLVNRSFNTVNTYSKLFEARVQIFLVLACIDLECFLAQWFAHSSIDSLAGVQLRPMEAGVALLEKVSY